jgi:type I restriction enzyme S subunit
MRSWPTKNLVEVAAKKRWALNGGPFGSKLSRKHYSEIGVPVIRGTNLPANAKFSFDDFVFVSEAKANELLANNAHPGDLIFTQRGTIGQVGLIPLDSPIPRFVISQSQMKLTVDPDQADALFLYYFFTSPDTVQKVQNLAFSAGVPHINLDILRKFETPVPPLAVQRRIAGILSAYDDLIENSQRRIRILEEMARVLYREWFVHFRFPGFDSAAEASRAPSSWKHTALKDVAEVRLGKMLDQSKNRGELMPYLANVNVRWGEFDVSALRMMRFEEHECEAYGLRVGDIVMCEGGEPGRCAIWRNQVDGVMIQKALHRIRCRAGMSFVYLYHCLRQLGENGFLSSLFTGSTIKHLPLEKLANVRLMVPHADLLAQFENVAGPIESQIFSLQCQIQVLRRNRDLLLPRLLSGQIDVEALT